MPTKDRPSVDKITSTGVKILKAEGSMADTELMARIAKVLGKKHKDDIDEVIYWIRYSDSPKNGIKINRKTKIAKLDK